MENTEYFLPEYSAKPKFEQTPATEREWQMTGQWARFFAIFGFVSIGANVLWVVYLLATTIPMFFSNPYLMQMIPSSIFWALGVVFVIFVVGQILLFRASRHHLRFARHIRRSLQNRDETALTSAWQHMNGAWKMYGIYTIMILCFTLIYLMFVTYMARNSPYL